MGQFYEKREIRISHYKSQLRETVSNALWYDKQSIALDVTIKKESTKLSFDSFYISPWERAMKENVFQFSYENSIKASNNKRQ